MKPKLAATKHSMKMIWGCAGIALVAVIVALTINAYVLLFVIPCMLMMGAMAWMMLGGMNGGQEADKTHLPRRWSGSARPRSDGRRSIRDRRHRAGRL